MDTCKLKPVSVSHYVSAAPIHWWQHCLCRRCRQQDMRDLLQTAAKCIQSLLTWYRPTDTCIHSVVGTVWASMFWYVVCLLGARLSKGQNPLRQFPRSKSTSP